MSPTLAVTLWWVAFAGAHVVLSSLPVRGRLIARMGARGFQGFYSLVVLVLFVPLVWTYATHKHTGPLLWSVPLTPAVRWVLYVGIATAFVLVVASFMTPSPAGMVPTKMAPRGVLRITRHPFVMGTALWALIHMAINGFATDVAFFGGFVVFALVGARHQDARKIATGVPGYREFCDATPFIPFTGRETLRGLGEMLPAAAIGVLVTAVVRHYHSSLFGG